MADACRFGKTLSAINMSKKKKNRSKKNTLEFFNRHLKPDDKI